MSEHKKRGRPAKAIKVDPKGATETYSWPVDRGYDPGYNLGSTADEPHTEAWGPQLAAYRSHPMEELAAAHSTEGTDMAIPDPEAVEQAVKAVLKSIYRSGQLDERRNLSEDSETIIQLTKGTQ